MLTNIRINVIISFVNQIKTKLYFINKYKKKSQIYLV